MINFFRRIRKKLADDNKPLKYMKYAIGEILLVVIGILIALQVNNWNEDRKSKVVEIELLKTIRTDLDRTLIDLKNDYESHLESQKNGNKFKRFLLGENMLEDSIFLHFSSLSQDRHFFPNSSGYESFKSSDMNIISNDSLRLEITELYELTFPRIKEWDESNPRWDISMALHPYYKKHFILTDQIVGNQLNYSRYPEYKFKIKSISEIRNDNELQIDLQETFQIRRRKIGLNFAGIDRIELVLAHINRELGKLNTYD
ncbi:DUF6090 family protein [Eudoraea adriatica]|uniref:DUF6090 family protein n=1 Tax=Eudoraea adriatica TaxID=446681 RepID=UPI0003A77661|nr:DUF6090 family protein [Eudoraea adriatica]